MKNIVLRPAENDFKQLAIWFSILDNEPEDEVHLREEYEEKKSRIIQQIAVDTNGKLVGFYWALRDRVVADRTRFWLFVEPEWRGQGIGGLLYEHLCAEVQRCASAEYGGAEYGGACAEYSAHTLRVSIWDNHPEYRAFAERRGFVEKTHQIAMELDLANFDDRPYDAIIARLENEGFRFTSMEELENSSSGYNREEAQRKLYILNDTTAATTPGSDGEHSWSSFEDFQKNVCQSDWYKPGGQIVAIDTAGDVPGRGAWAAMSAITRFAGARAVPSSYAYNLFTGVDVPYRGRKLGQAVKVIALRYARQVLQVNTVRTHHNAKNLPMIAIDRKFGYIQQPGTYLMEKVLHPGCKV